MEAILSGSNQPSRTDRVPAHRRLLLALLLVSVAVLSTQTVSFALYLAIAGYLWLRSPLGLVPGVKRLLVIDSVVLLTVLPLPFSYVDSQTVQWAGLSLSQVGIEKAVDIIVKSTICLMVMMSQCSGMSGLELGQALRRLKVPGKFILLLQFSIRYISVMQQELCRLRIAMRARGFGNGPTLHNWRSYGYMFGMLLVRALARADRIWLAMKCRGYTGCFPVSNDNGSSPGSRSLVVIVVLTLLVFASDISLLMTPWSRGA
jgi:cobalt/nickel transport system permease protein